MRGFLVLIFGLLASARGQTVDDCIVDGRFLELDKPLSYSSDTYVSRVFPRCIVAGNLSRFEVKLAQSFSGVISLVSSTSPSTACAAAFASYSFDSQLARRVTNARLVYFYLGTSSFKYSLCFNGVTSSAYIVSLEANDASCYLLNQSSSSYTQPGSVSCVFPSQDKVTFDGFSVVPYRGLKQCTSDCTVCTASGGSDCLCNGLFNTNTCNTCASNKCMYDSIGFGQAFVTNSTS